MVNFTQILTREQENELRLVAAKMVTPGKGLFAADFTAHDMQKPFDQIGMENSVENRRLLRQMLFTTDDSLGEYLTGMILNDEIFYQKTDDGVRFVDVLKKKGILSGITVDRDHVPLYNTDNEQTTQGLDDLLARAKKYKAEGATFAKWRSVYRISNATPSHTVLHEASQVAARYASICQLAGLVPIIEPEALFDGDHTLAQCQKVTETMLSYHYRAFNDLGVFIEGTILKPSMVLPGKDSADYAKHTHADVALANVIAMQRAAPAAIPGIAFLSGGQTAENATVHLNAINQVQGRKPWVMTFCFGRGLQVPAFNAWAGKPENVAAGQAAFLERAKLNALATQGKLPPGAASCTAC